MLAYKLQDLGSTGLPTTRSTHLGSRKQESISSPMGMSKLIEPRNGFWTTQESISLLMERSKQGLLEREIHLLADGQREAY